MITALDTNILVDVSEPDPVKRPSRKTQLINGRLQQHGDLCVDAAKGFNLPAAHLGIAIDFGAPKSFALN